MKKSKLRKPSLYAIVELAVNAFINLGSLSVGNLKKFEGKSRTIALKSFFTLLSTYDLHLVRGRALAEIFNERQRQQLKLNHPPKMDDTYDKGELAAYAGTYLALYAAAKHRDESDPEPHLMRHAAHLLRPYRWSRAHVVPETCGSDLRGALVKAGALIVAELERLDRKGKKPQLELHMPDYYDSKH